MSAIIMDGKKVAAEIEAEIKQAIIDEGLSPKLLIVTDGHDQASKVYIRNKVKAAERCGIEADIVEVHSFLTRDICELYENYDGIIVQLPMKNDYNAKALIKLIPYEKDVDGLTANSLYDPCTPMGIIQLLRYYQIPIEGKHAVIVGRSELVGKPLARMLLDRDATVTVCHSKTKGLAGITPMADILISAVGNPGLIVLPMIKENAVVVDVGINRVDGKLCGDVDWAWPTADIKNHVSHITPVPGGVGPMTVAMLMENTLYAARMRKEEEEC